MSTTPEEKLPVFPKLAAKISAPRMRRDMVFREALVRRLTDGMHRKITLIAAPAGFGKTSLVCQWQKQSERAVAWLCLDQEDNEERRFLSYLIRAFQFEITDFGEKILPVLLAPKLPPFNTLIARFIEELNRLPRETTLVIDDYHFINNQLLHKAMEFLLLHLPANLHLIISTRSDPPLPLMKLRSRDQLTEIRTVDLRFSAAEADAFLNQTLKFSLSPEELILMDKRIEGWIAGWQLAVISLKEQEDIGAFIRSFAGDDRYVLDYLLEQVFERQSAEIRDFLLLTSILNRLCAPLCNALTGRTDGQDNLTYLDGANLFINALDSKRQWYRYHQLFADLLQARLSYLQKDKIPELHRRAGAWFESEGMLPDALSHFIRAADWTKTMQLLNQLAWSRKYQGPTATLIRWLTAIPEEILFKDPMLCLFYAEYLAILGEIESCKTFLKRLAQTWETDPDMADSAALWHIRGNICFIENNFADTVKYAQRVLPKLPAGEKIIRASATIAMAMGNLFLGKLPAVEKVVPEALALNQAIGNSFGIARCFNITWKQLILRGRLTEAESALAQMHRSARGLFAHQMVLPNIYLAWIHYQWNDLENARKYIDIAFQVVQRTGRTPAVGYAHKVLSEIFLAMGEREAAYNEMQKGLNFIKTPALHLFTGELHAYQAQLYLQNGDFESVAAWIAANQAALDAPPTLENEQQRLVAARFWIETGETERALHMLQQSYRETAANERTDSLIKIILVQAKAALRTGRRGEAQALVAKALTLSEKGGYIRFYLDESPDIRELLASLAKITGAAKKSPQLSFPANYLARILAAYPLDDTADASEAVLESNTAPDIYHLDPLSERELEVLRLIKDGLSNNDIAERLFISLNTVKTHTKKINQKLNVSSRTQAVARAQQWSLI